MNYSCTPRAPFCHMLHIRDYHKSNQKSTSEAPQHLRYTHRGQKQCPLNDQTLGLYSYFEDKIFALSDEQKELAENYVQNLSVFLGDGMMQGLLPAESADRVSLGDIRFSDGATQVVYYNQLDKRYADPDYPAPRGGQDQDTAQPRPADPADLPPLCVRRAAAVCGLLRKNCPP